MTPSEYLSPKFSALVTNTQFASLPPEAIEAAKKSILDTVGVIFAASRMEPALEGVMALVAETGGKRECSVFPYGEKTSAIMAAFANGAMAHCLDFDDHTPWGQHASSSVVPAALAAAERVGGVSGKELIVAVAVGQDIFARLRCNVRWKKDWNLSTVFGVFGATAAVARVLGLSEEKTKNAFAIASMQSSGVMEVVAGTGGDLRAIYAGFSAKGAVLAALLAEKGVTSVSSLFEGTYGVFNSYFGGEYNSEKILDEIGSRFDGGATLYKPWPAVGTSHSHIHATIQLINEHAIEIADIAEIRVFVGDYHQLMCTPLDARRRPTTLVDAKFSLPYLVAVAAVRGKMTIMDFTPEALTDPLVLSVAEKVVPVVDPTLDWNLELPAGRVEIVTKSGRSFDRRGVLVPGSHEAPLNWAQIQKKFEECIASSLTADQIAGVIEKVRKLDYIGDVREVINLLSPMERRETTA